MPTATKARKPKKLTLKYDVGTQLKTEDGLEVEILEIERCYSDIPEYSDVIVDANYICKDLNQSVEDGEEIEELVINAKGKFRKFTKRLTKDEKELIESKESRENFQYVDDGSKLDSYIEFPNVDNIEELKKSSEIGFDIETYGIAKKADGLVPSAGRIRLIQVYLPESKRSIIWDCGELVKPKNIDELFGINILKQKLFSRDCKIFIHNAKFESAWMAEHLKVPILNVIDSMILSQLYWAGLIRGFNKIGVHNPNGLDQVILRLFGVKPDKANQGYDYAMPLGNSQYNYAGLDAKLTYAAGKKLLQMCLDDGLGKVVEAEMMAIPAFAQMNYKGVPVDVAKLQELLGIYTNAAEKALAPWLETFPKSNPGSPKQVLECLKEKWGIEPYSVDSKTKEKKLSSDNATLTPFALENPIIDALLFWRSLRKDCEYLQQYLSKVKIVNGFEVLTGNYTQNAPQVTGRSSSSKPNLQNIPTPTPKREKLGLPPLRKGFRAPEGYKFILVDLAASHQQIGRFVSQDRKLIEANETGVKFHFFTVQSILEIEGIKCEFDWLSKGKSIAGCRKTIKNSKKPKEVEEAKVKLEKLMNALLSEGLTPEKIEEVVQHVARLYDPAKTVFYGNLNLQSGQTLQNSFLKKADMMVDLETCKKFVEGGRKAYPGLFNFQKQLVTKANSQRENRTFTVNTEYGSKKVGALTGIYGTARSIDGSRLFIEKMPNKFKPGTLQCSATDAVSYMWLRTEGTIMKKSLGLVNDFIIDNKIPGWISQFCHDEIMCCVKEESAYQLAEFMLNKITEVFREFVPDYQIEDPDPNSYIINDWSEK
jgi:DNA polymerase I-like protein with 3'-5' exonuclease and polymerase domains